MVAVLDTGSTLVNKIRILSTFMFFYAPVGNIGIKQIIMLVST